MNPNIGRAQSSRRGIRPDERQVGDRRVGVRHRREVELAVVRLDALVPATRELEADPELDESTKAQLPVEVVVVPADGHGVL